MRPSPRSCDALTLSLTLVLAPVLGLSQATPTTKQAPPPGIPVSAADAAELTAGLQTLGRQLEALHTNPKVGADLLRLLPDLQVFHKAVRYALRYGEFFKADEIESARAQLAVATQRAKALAAGQSGWTSGPLVCGYQS